MIKLNFLKIGLWGLFWSCIAMVMSIGTLMLFIPDGETALLWLIYLGSVAVVAKFAAIISIVLIFVGLVADRTRQDHE